MEGRLNLQKRYERFAAYFQGAQQTSLQFSQQRVLMVSDDFLPAKTGVGSYLQQTSQDLVQRGHHVVILTSRRPGQPKLETWNGIIVYRLFSVKVADFYQALASQKTIRKIIQDNNINLIHQNYISFLLTQVYKVGHELGIPQIYTCHMSVGHLTQPWFMRPFKPFLEWRMSRQYNKFDFILSPSQAVADEVRALGLERPILTLSNPVKMTKTNFTAAPATRHAGFQILFAGRLAPEKNVPLLLKAFALLKKTHADSCLAIAGAGPEREKLEKMTKELNISSSVHFLGQLNSEALAQEYAGCDTFVLPSTLETQGIVVLEAMSFAKPVILTKANACAAELVNSGQNGYIVDAKNPEEMTLRLRELANSEDLRKKLGTNSLVRSKDFAPEDIIQMLQIVYQTVANKNS